MMPPRFDLNRPRHVTDSGVKCWLFKTATGDDLFVFDRPPDRVPRGFGRYRLVILDRITRRPRRAWWRFTAYGVTEILNQECAPEPPATQETAP